MNVVFYFCLLYQGLNRRDHFIPSPAVAGRNQQIVRILQWIQILREVTFKQISLYLLVIYPLNFIHSLDMSNVRWWSCQFFNYELNTEVPMLIQPTILEIFAENWLHRVFGFTVVWTPNQYFILRGLRRVYHSLLEATKYLGVMFECGLISVCGHR